MKTALITAAAALLMAAPAQASRGSYGFHRGTCSFNGAAEPCFIREISRGLHQVTWLSDGKVVTYAETNAGSYVESNGVRYSARVSGGCTLPTNGCFLRFVTQNGTTTLPALYALN